MTGKQQARDQEREVLNRVRMRRLIPFQHIKLMARELSIPHGCIAVLCEILAR
jgi:hypothetical protein